MNQDITSFLPQRAPFLFIDEVVEKSEKHLHTRLSLSGEEEFFKGHFPDMPIMPGVLLLEACFQSAAALIGMYKTAHVQDTVGVVTKVENARFKGLVRPGDILDIQVEKTDELLNAAYFKAKVSCQDKVVCAVNFQVATIARPQVIKQ